MTPPPTARPRAAGPRFRSLLVAVLLASALPARGQTPEAPSPASGRYEVHLLTMDRGDAVWERFGHNALLIVDRVSGQELAWNWGLFDFGQEAFIPRLLRGTMEYSMGPADASPFLASYVAANRTVYANEILLTQEEAAALDAFVRWNFQPENRAYPYDYYRDNCSTRLRDALDGVLGGILRERFEDVPTPHSYRWHSRRLTAGTTWLDQGMSLLLGMPTDRPITEWETAFLPMELLRLLEGVERPGVDGVLRPLLGPRQLLFEADRAPTPEAPPPFSPAWMLLGLVLAGGIGAAGHGMTTAGNRIARIGMQGALVGWGLLAGLLGTLLFLGWFSDHRVMHWNLNLFHMSPLALALPWIAASLPRLRSGDAFLPPHPIPGARLARWIAAGSFLAALVPLLPGITQGNAEVVAVSLPVNLAFAWTLTRPGRAAVPRP